MGTCISNSITFKRRFDIEKQYPELEHLWLEIPGRNKNSKLVLGVVYRSERILSPHCWLEQIETLLTDLVSTWEGMLVVTGDVNIDLSPNTSLTRSYNETLQTLNLHQLVSKPTRVTKTSSTLIDHIVSNCPHRATLTNVLPCPTVSDHDAP